MTTITYHGYKISIDGDDCSWCYMRSDVGFCNHGPIEQCIVEIDQLLSDLRIKTKPGINGILYSMGAGVWYSSPIAAQNAHNKRIQNEARNRA